MKVQLFLHPEQAAGIILRMEQEGLHYIRLWFCIMRLRNDGEDEEMSSEDSIVQTKFRDKKIKLHLIVKSSASLRYREFLSEIR